MKRRAFLATAAALPALRAAAEAQAKGGMRLGVIAMIVVMALFNGFYAEIQKNLFTATAHFTVAHGGGDIPDEAAALAILRATPGVEAASPIRVDRGLLKPADPEAPPEGLLVKAVDPAHAHGTSSIFDSLQPIRVEDLKEGEIILGRDLADTMIRPAQSEIAPVATQLFANDRLPRSNA